MGIILFLIVGCVLAFVGFIIYSVDTNKSNQGIILPTKQRFKSADDTQEQFKEAYLWACSVFGVYESIYDSIAYKSNCFRSLGIEYFTYYKVSEYRCLYYPYMSEIEERITDWRSSKQQEEFALGFISKINSIRNRVDVEEIRLFSKYNIPFKNLLTREFKVDNMQLFSLPQ